MSDSAWMNTELTHVNVRVNSLLGTFSFLGKLLAWDSYECHIDESVVKSLQSKKDWSCGSTRWL